MDTLVKAFGVGEQGCIPFFVFVCCCTSIFGNGIAEVLFAGGAKVAQGEAFSIHGNEAIGQVGGVNLAAGRTILQLKWFKIIFDEMCTERVEFGMTSLCFNDKVSDDAGMIGDRWVTGASSMCVGAGLCILVKFGHELHDRCH